MNPYRAGDIPLYIHVIKSRVFLNCHIYIRFMSTKITEVNLSAFAYRLFHEDFSSIIRVKCSLHFALMIDEKSS